MTLAVITKIITRTILRPKLNSPIMVSGVPDSGHVAKLAMDHLVSSLQAKPFIEIYSYGFQPQVLVKKDGTVELMKNHLHYWNNPKNGHDVILFTADDQQNSPEAAYLLCDKVLGVAKSLGVDLVYAVGASIVGTFVEKPRVFCTATDPSLLADLVRLGFLSMNHGNITWMNGLIMGLTKVKGMRGIFLSGETSGYIADPKAARVVVEALATVLRINVDTRELMEKADEMEKAIRKMAREDPYNPALGPESGEGQGPRFPPEPYR